MGAADLDLTRAGLPRAEARAFFERDALALARALVGATLVVARGADVRAVRVVETEAYRGPKDAACHATAGLTRRNRALFGPPGHAYVFLVYGMHVCFNVVCHREGSGHAVLVRAGEPLFGVDPRARTDGPGKVTRALGVTLKDDGLDLVGGAISVAAPASGVRVARGPRVGVAYAGADADRPWRFYDAASRHVSRPPRSAIGRGGG